MPIQSLQTPTQNTHAYYQHIMKFPYRTPTHIITYNKTPIQITHTESQANPEQARFVCIYQSFVKELHTYYFYQSLVNTSVVI